VKYLAHNPSRNAGSAWLIPLHSGTRHGAKLGWRHKTSFDALVKEMVAADLIAIRDEHTRRNLDG
jgi:GDP-D-mannose dehydratase